MTVVVYTTSIIANASIRKQQADVLEFLRRNKVDFEEIDLSVHTGARPIMLKRIPDSKQKKPTLPPQVFSGEEYLGDHESFFNANEMGTPFTFFKLSPPKGSREELLLKKYSEQGIKLQF